MNANEDNLFDRLGGADALVDIVDQLYVRIFSDPDLSVFFLNAPMDRLRKMQFQFLAAAFDGPVNYSGAELTAAHTGRDISGTDFAKFCSHFADVLESRNIDQKDIDQALARLATFKDKITGDANVDG